MAFEQANLTSSELTVSVSPVCEVDPSDDWKTEILVVSSDSLNQAEQESLFKFLTSDDVAAMQCILNRIARELRQRDPLMPSSNRVSPLGLRAVEWQLLSQVSGYVPGRSGTPVPLAAIETKLSKRLTVAKLQFDVAAISAFRKLFAGTLPDQAVNVVTTAKEADSVVDSAPVVQIQEQDIGTFAVAALTVSEPIPLCIEPEPVLVIPTEQIVSKSAQMVEASKVPAQLVSAEEIETGVALDKYMLAARSGLTHQRVSAVITKLIRDRKLLGTGRPMSMLNRDVGRQTDNYYGRALTVITAALQSVAEATQEQPKTK